CGQDDVADCERIAEVERNAFSQLDADSFEDSARKLATSPGRRFTLDGDDFGAVPFCGNAPRIVSNGAPAFLWLPPRSKDAGEDAVFGDDGSNPNQAVRIELIALQVAKIGIGTSDPRLA